MYELKTCIFLYLFEKNHHNFKNERILILKKFKFDFMFKFDIYS